MAGIPTTGHASPLTSAVNADEGWNSGMDRAAREEILRARARVLAQEPMDSRRASDELEVLVFVLSEGNVAIESGFVREVLPLKEITPLPTTPAFVLGIINARGQILSVIDIKRFFDMNHQALSNLNKIVVVENRLIEFGILVDEVVGVTTVPATDIQPPPAALAESYGDYVKGVTARGLLILNMGRILGDERLIMQEEVT